MQILKLIRLGASEEQVKAAFSNWTALPPHPSKTAIGYVGIDDGQPMVVICYFMKGLFTSRLARAVVDYLPAERGPDDRIALRHAEVMNQLTAFLGVPKSDETDAVRAAPVEFRMSRMTVWVDRGSVVTLGMALLRDGVRPAKPALALSVADSKLDPEARITAGRLRTASDQDGRR